jgi:hypothetical protein
MIVNSINTKIIFLLHEQFKVYKKVKTPSDVSLHRFQRCPLLLVQLNAENHRIRIFNVVCIYTSNHGQ